MKTALSLFLMLWACFVQAQSTNSIAVWQLPEGNKFSAPTNTYFLMVTQSALRPVTVKVNASNLLQSLYGLPNWSTNNLPTNVILAPFVGATAGADGTQGQVPKPLAGQQTNFLRGDGTWAIVTNATGGGVSANTPLYVRATFLWSSNSVYWPVDVPGLIIQYSTDLTNFFNIRPDGGEVYHDWNNLGIRDPSIIWHPSNRCFYVVYTRQTGLDALTFSLGFIQSYDLINWTRVWSTNNATPGLGQIITPYGVSWAPEWFVEGTNYYILYSGKYNLGRQIYEIHNTDSGLHGWAGNTVVASNTISANLALLDPWMVKTGALYTLNVCDAGWETAPAHVGGWVLYTNTVFPSLMKPAFTNQNPLVQAGEGEEFHQRADGTWQFMLPPGIYGYFTNWTPAAWTNLSNFNLPQYPVMPGPRGCYSGTTIGVTNEARDIALRAIAAQGGAGIQNFITNATLSGNFYGATYGAPWFTNQYILALDGDSRMAGNNAGLSPGWVRFFTNSVAHPNLIVITNFTASGKFVNDPNYDSGFVLGEADMTSNYWHYVRYWRTNYPLTPGIYLMGGGILDYVSYTPEETWSHISNLVTIAKADGWKVGMSTIMDWGTGLTVAQRQTLTWVNLQILNCGYWDYLFDFAGIWKDTGDTNNFTDNLHCTTNACMAQARYVYNQMTFPSFTSMPGTQAEPSWWYPTSDIPRIRIGTLIGMTNAYMTNVHMDTGMVFSLIVSNDARMTNVTMQSGNVYDLTTMGVSTLYLTNGIAGGWTGTVTNAHGATRTNYLKFSTGILTNVMDTP